MRITPMALTLLVAACAASQPAPAKYGENSVQAQMLRYYGSQLVDLHCNGEWAGAGVHTATEEGISFRQPCGLLALDLSKDPSAQCPAQDSGECTQRVSSMFEGRLLARYNPDRNWIANHCRGYPKECDSFIELEELYLKSHNQRVLASWESAQYQLAAARQRYEDENKLFTEVLRHALWWGW